MGSSRSKRAAVGGDAQPPSPVTAPGPVWLHVVMEEGSDTFSHLNPTEHLSLPVLLGGEMQWKISGKCN